MSVVIESFLLKCRFVAEIAVFTNLRTFLPLSLCSVKRIIGNRKKTTTKLITVFEFKSSRIYFFLCILLYNQYPPKSLIKVS